MTIGGGTLIIGIVPGAVMGVVLHELVHGVFFLAFGGRPRFGFKPWTRLGPVFYAAAPGSYFTKLEYAASGLAPAVLLTVLLAVALDPRPPTRTVDGAATNVKALNREMLNAPWNAAEPNQALADNPSALPSSPQAISHIM